MRLPLFAAFAGVFAFLMIAWSSAEPSNNRDWSVDQQRLPYASINNGAVQIFNIRNFTYITKEEYIPAYYNASFDLEKLDSIWYGVEPFSTSKGAAHTFLSFGFGDTYLAVSVEIRKEKDEEFSALKGLFRQYELMYVLGDERDIIKLRSNYRNDTVYLYPVNTSTERMQDVFLNVLQRVNGLYRQPEFYNTITNTCTTNLVEHANSIVPGRVPFSIKILLPVHSDKLAYDIGLLDTNLSFEEARERFKINDRARIYADHPNFSLHIRP